MFGDRADLVNFFKGVGREYGGILIGMVAICAFFAWQSDRFLSLNNAMNIMEQVSVIALVAFGMTFVILLGEIDLSVGSIIAVSGMVAAQCLAAGYGIPETVALAVLAGMVLGGLNGVITAKLMLPSFIVTVATMGIFRGLVSLPTGGVPAPINDDTFFYVGTERAAGLPVLVWIMLCVFIVAHIVLSKTVFGRRIYLAGGNREAAIYSGIKVDTIRIAAFVISGVAAAISGLLLAARLGSAQTNAGTGYELDAIAAVVLGGTSLVGGVGTIIGTLLGTLIIGIINNGMNLLSVPYFYQLIVKGLVILVAVWLDVRSKRL